MAKNQKPNRTSGNRGGSNKAERARKNFNQSARKNMKREQPKKDSSSKRVNFDNAREDRVAKQIMRDANSGKFNDINDFLKNPTLVQAASNIPIFPIIGNSVGDLAPVPGAMVIRWVPEFGCLENGDARVYDVDGTVQPVAPAPFAINQAKDTTYSFLVHANSRNYSYNSSDLFLLIMAGGQVFSALESMKRAYGIIRRYVETSSYMPDSLLRGMGFEPDDLRQNFPNMWFDINMLISQTRQIWIPNSFPLVSRWIDMNSEIYKDAEGVYSQLYMFVQGQYYMYNETAVKSGGCLTQAGYSTIDSEGKERISPMTPGLALIGGTSTGFLTYTWEQWVSMVQNMINALVNSEDRGIIYGDMLNAYTAERIVAIPEIPVDYTVDPVYTPEISMQIENLTVSSNSYIPMGWGQIENRLVPFWSSTAAPTTPPSASAGGFKNWSINFHTTSDPTPEMILLATRFMCLGMRQAIVPVLDSSTNEFQTAAAYLPITHGSELVVDVTLINSPIEKASSGRNVAYKSLCDLNQFASISTVESASGRTAWKYLMTFDWHPFVSQISSDDLKYPALDSAVAAKSNDCSVTVHYTWGDQDRYGEITWQELKRINDVAFLSLYDVPSVLS